MHSVTVDLGERSYPVHIGHGMLPAFARACSTHRLPEHLALLTDSNVARLHLKPLLLGFRRARYRVCPIIIPPGEGQKSLRRAGAICTALLEEGLGRESAVIALGGGVIGDLGGFVAAMYLRGIPVVQIPTTLLSQVDSSIGGKTGVNLPLGKNLIGAFHQPRFVWSDVALLRTLPSREVTSGLGEVVKYAILGGPPLFDDLETNVERLLRLEEETVLRFVTLCATQKADLVARDEREEQGLRTALNLGHTIGHALEAAGGFRLWKHGEAVMLGLVAESFIARSLGHLDEANLRRICALVRRLAVPARLDRVRMPDILLAMGHDKKKTGKTVRFVLPTRIGGFMPAENVPAALIRESIRRIPALLSAGGLPR